MNSGPVPQLFRDAASAHKAGRIAEAERAYRNILILDPKNFDALRMLGLLVGQAGNLAAGIRSMREALSLRPDSADAMADLGELLRRNGETEAAAASLEAALQRKSGHYQANNSLGSIRLAQSRLAEAAACYAAATRAMPSSAEAWHNLGLAQQMQKQYANAIVAYRRALKIAPNRLNTAINLAKAFAENKQPADAIAAYRSVLALKEDHVPALRELATLQADAGDREAIETVRRAIRYDPKDGKLHTLLGQTLTSWGQFDDAAKSYETAIGLRNAEATAYFGLSRCRKFTVADQSFIAAMESALERPELKGKEQSDLHFALGKVLDDIGRYGDAIAHFDEGNRLRPLVKPFDRTEYSTTVDRIVNMFDLKGIGDFRAAASLSDRPILIVGMWRSGTTLTEQILASHPDVAAGDEISFWTQRLSEFVPETGVASANPARAVKDYLRILDGISAVKPRVTDKMPLNFVALGLIHALYPNARIIHCKRNPIDTCLSIYFTSFNGFHAVSHDRGNLVFFYKEYLRLMEHWRRVIPANRLLEVEYEELIANQESVSRRIVDFCGLEWSDSCLAFHETERSIRTASHWQARQPIYKSSLARWRRYEPWLGEFRQLLTDDGGSVG